MTASRCLLAVLLFSLLATAELLAQQREEVKRAEAKRAEEAAFQAAHDEAFLRAQVWLPPDTPIIDERFKENVRKR